ncbi:MAG: PEP-utilizing enzyme [Patescibacteria group bacterium]|nr:PEP-utilizing enzyme [Patescibacteria group bacterium]
MDINKRIIYSKDKKIFEINKNDNYFPVVSRKLLLLYKSIAVIGITDNDIYQKIFGFPTAYRPFYDSRHGIYFNKKAVEYEEKQILKKILKDSKYLEKIAKKCEMDGDRVLNFSKQIKKTDFSKKADQQIKNIIKEFLRSYIKFTAYMMPILSTQNYLEKNIKETIKTHIKSKEIAEEYFNNLTRPIKGNFGYFEQIEILKLATFYKNNKNKMTAILKRKVNKYLIDFNSIGVKYGIGKLWTKKDVIERIVYLSKKDPDKKLEHLQNLPKFHQEKINNIFKKIKADNDFKKFFKIARTYIYLRTYRTDIISNAFANLFFVFEEIAKRNNVKLEDVLKCLFNEIIDFNIPDRNFLNLRNKTILIRSINGKAYYIYGKEADKLTNNIKKSIGLFDSLKRDKGYRKKATNVLIRGTVANKGHINGKVKIVLDNSQLYKVLEGDIIVAFMTTPDFVPAMEKASAFITDEGGILCHAAIVAREMKKPCVIGTKIATKVLKDGDLVEVDADKGVVKILKK